MQHKHVVYHITVVLGAFVAGAYIGAESVTNLEAMRMWGALGAAALLWGTYRLHIKG
jgi:hypothetical protein